MVEPVVWDHEVARSSRVSRTKIIIFMEDFIKEPNPFCIQIVEGYIIQTTPSDSESCLAPDQFGNYCICQSRGDNPAKIRCCFICENHSEYSDYIIQAQVKYRIYVNSKMES